MDFTRLTDFLETLADRGVPGCDCAVYQNRRQVYRHSTGFADLESKTPIASDTLYRLYSMTKIITCTAALRLYEKGLFLLSDPLSAYIPEFSDMRCKKVAHNGAVKEERCTRPILIRDLFTMSSGYSYENTPELRAAFEEFGEQGTTQQFAGALAKSALLFEPGTRWHYGYSHDIIGALIERLSGKRFSQFLREEIFGPLGMEDTFFRVPKEKASRMASCYGYDPVTKQHEKWSNGDYRNLDNAFESGGGGLVSTVNDYAAFADCLCNGAAKDGFRLLSRSTVDMMRTNHLDGVRLEDFNNPGNGYGLGVCTLMDTAAAGRNGTIGEFGWSGMAGTNVLMDPARGIVVLYAQQLDPSDGGYIHPRINNIVYGCLE